MAATNLADILDPALTRPGRFDRHVSIQFLVTLLSIYNGIEDESFCFGFCVELLHIWCSIGYYLCIFQNFAKEIEMTDMVYIRLWSQVRMSVDAKRFWNSTSKANLCQMMWMLKLLLVELLDSMVLVSI